MAMIRTLARPITALAAVTAIAMATFVFAPTAQAGPDVSGTWHIDAEGDLPGECSSIIMQDGASLTSFAQCSIVGNLAFEGSIDTATGEFSITDNTFSAVVEGTFSPDGNSLTATYTALGGSINGTLAGTRTSTDISIVDLSGAWMFVYGGRSDGDGICDATIVQDFLDLTATIDCPSGTSVRTGSVNPFTGSFYLLSDDPFEGEIYADPAGDGSGMLAGQWYDGEGFGAFYALPDGSEHSGIVSMGCGGAFPGYCGGMPGDTITVDVEVALPPDGGYDGFSVAIRGDNAVPYVPADDPASEVPGCSAPEREIVTSEGSTTITFTCAAGDAIAGTNPIVSIDYACPDSSEFYTFSRVTLLTDGTSLSQGDASFAPYLAGASGLDCYNDIDYPHPVPYLPEEAFLAADVNCDGRPDAIDAALVLQLDAGLIEGFPCGTTGDSSMDGSTNSIDASLILQMVAGLVLSEPEVAPPIID